MHVSLDFHSMNDLAIIIVSWNCWEYLAQCLRSIAKSGTRHSYNVQVVDNSSTDDTVPLLQAQFPTVRVIANNENRGFAAANNQALRQTRARFVLLLNPDTVIHDGAIDALGRFLEDHQDAWAVGPAILNADGSPQESGVQFPSMWNIVCETFFLDRIFPESRLFGRHKELYEDQTKPRAVGYVQGACLMVRWGAIETIGPLDERFFMYFEETDWCYRMAQAGGKVYHCPDAKVTHFGAGELGHFDERRILHYHQSLLQFFRKHYTWTDILLLRSVLLLRSLVRVLVWAAVWVVKPGERKTAASSMRGYARTLGMALGG
jgi:GT2 family glycosyltransferase